MTNCFCVAAILSSKEKQLREIFEVGIRKQFHQHVYFLQRSSDINVKDQFEQYQDSGIERMWASFKDGYKQCLIDNAEKQGKD